MVRANIKKLNDTLAKLEIEIERLIQKRTLLRRQLNELVSSTRKLPAEVLSEIFRLTACVPNLREPQLYYLKLKDLLGIGTVCSQWREVAWSAASLWTTCLLEMIKREDGFGDVPRGGRSIPLTKLVLRNTRYAPVSVRINLAELSPEFAHLLFTEHRAHIGALRVTMPDEGVEGWELLCSVFESSYDWPCLKELWLEASDFLPLEGPLFRVSQGLHYARRSFDATPWNIPSNQITVLHLRNIPIDQCLYLLFQCSSLAEYHCIDAGRSSKFYEPIVILPHSQRPVSLPSIKIFCWKQHGHWWKEKWSLLLYTSFRFPGLKRLYWGNCCPRSSFNEIDRILREEFILSLNHITTLDWEARHYFLSHFTYFCGRATFNSLQQLYISTPTSHSFIHWLEKLTLADGYDDSNQSNWLPNLRILHVNIGSLEFGEERTFRAIQSFLCSRRNKPRSQNLSDVDWYYTPCEEYWATHTRLERFIVETATVPLRIAGNQLAVLRTLVSRGLVLELVVPSEGDRQRRTIL